MNFPKFSELIRTIERSLATLFGSWLTTASSALDYLLATIAALLIGMPFLTQVPTSALAPDNAYVAEQK